MLQFSNTALPPLPSSSQCVEPRQPWVLFKPELFNITLIAHMGKFRGYFVIAIFRFLKINTYLLWLNSM